MKQYEQICQGDRNVPDDLVYAFDLSLSMGERDLKPSRLKGAIKAAKRLLDIKKAKHTEDRVGIVGFSAKARVIHDLVEVCNNVTSLKHSLSGVETSSWTNITAGLLAARKLLGQGPTNSNGSGFLGRFFKELC